MRIRFATPEATGLKVIEEIPDYKVCHIEGRNGVGKTLAIRLLELISGEQPFSTLPHAWASLKDQLGTTTVTFTGLPEGELAVVLTPEQWPGEPLPHVDGLGTATLDGKPVSLEQVRRFVHVHRIAGDETLTETLALELAERAAQARLVDRAVAPTFGEWDTELEHMAQLVAHMSPAELVSLQEAEAETAARSSAINVDSKSTATRLSYASSALRSTHRLRRRRIELEGLLSELDSAAKKLSNQEAKIEELTERMARLSAQQNLSSIEEELGRWDRLSRYRTTAHGKAVVEERQMLRVLGLTQRPAEAERRQMELDARSAAEAYNVELRRLDNVGGLRNLLSGLDATLSGAPTAVDDELVTKEPVPLTTEVLRQGIRSRRDDLVGVPQPVEVEDLTRKAKDEQLRAVRLSYLRELVRVSDRKADLLKQAVAKIDELWTQVEGSADLQSLSSKLRAEGDARLALALAVLVAEQALAELLGTQPVDTSKLLPDFSPEDVAEATDDDTSDGEAPSDDPEGAESEQAPPSPDDPMDRAQWEAIAGGLDAQTIKMVRAVGLAADDGLAALDEVDAVIVQLTELVDDLTMQSVQLEEDRAIARREARTARDALTLYIERAGQSLSDLRGDRWVEYRTGLTSLLGDVDSNSIESVSAALQRVALFVTQLREHMADVRNGLGQLMTYLEAEKEVLSGRGDGRSTGVMDSFELSRGQRNRIRTWAEGELAGLIGSDALRNELFDGAPEITVDLRHATVAWESPLDGRLRRRPFEAFSSGEQAFAYTKAKLDLLRESPPAAEHVVVVLDEFGAFVARDRFGQLMEFVANTALGTVAEQIVVILPLADDYALDGNADDLVRAASGAVDSVHLDRVAQLADRQYFALPAGPT